MSGGHDWIRGDVANHDHERKTPFAATIPGNITSPREFDAGDTLGIYTEAYES